MPHTPDPDEDGPAARPPHPPVYYAEQALLGGLLAEPQRLADVSGIGPQAFSTAAHTAVFTAIRALPAPPSADTTDWAAAFAALRARSGPVPTERTDRTTWLDTVLASAREQAHGLTAAHLHALISACPNPRHIAAYARIIEGEHARRRLHRAAQHLIQTAQDASLPHPVPTVFAEADALASMVDDIAAAFPPHSGSLPRTPAPPPPPVRDGEEAAQEERLLLATCAARPADAEQMRWLTADDFTRPLHAGLWQCLTTLIRRGAPIDRITLIWEAQQRGLLSHADSPRDLLGLLDETDVCAPYLGERILHRSALTTAQHAGRRIAAFTDDAANTPYQLVVGSRRALADLTAVRTRWHQATTTTATTGAPRRTARTAAPGAGPPRTTVPPISRSTR
ncbi:replicative DNA helicase [Streptomyces sp. SID8366]|uniref:DnaB-like helicase N-terminal domain-containing protein n=1 Tax=unclassified Streptomyces TaxID=2593676 RepID=UPI000DB93F6F|nr:MULTISPECIES: DnaB-like helicase N-terminal domain-containing protein [unclassified Streptomyces]MYU06166.1 replicative DNA helicase [Streptomyces sp. SID8366]MYU61740.1 replicative DNA helicase [Streptomyces sp. SID69]RAJ64239.1 DnaB helicase-like protein [Streptomyces sp. PsTaAH-130]